MKSVIITGASGNLGSSVAAKLRASGFSILGTVSSARSVETMKQRGIDARPVDLADEQAVREFVDGLEVEVSAAILTVGGFTAGSFSEADGESLRKMYRLNFETAYFLVQALLPRFEESGQGQFILIGSRPALEPLEGKEVLAYALSKKLVFFLAELINAYGKGKKIYATVLVPATIDTPANRAAQPDADYSNWISTEAVADTVQFLLGDSGSQIRESVIKLYNEA